MADEPEMVVVPKGDRFEVRWAERFGGYPASTWLDFATEAEAEAWIQGYEQGARENM